MIYARTAKVGPGCREVRAGADRVDATGIDRDWASTLPRRWSVAGAERTSGRRGTRRERRPRHAVTGRAGS